MIKAFKFFKGRFNKNELIWQEIGFLDNVANRENMINVLDITVQYLLDGHLPNSGLDDILLNIMGKLYKDKMENYPDEKIHLNIMCAEVIYNTDDHINTILTSGVIGIYLEAEIVSFIVEKLDWTESNIERTLNI